MTSDPSRQISDSPPATAESPWTAEDDRCLRDLLRAELAVASPPSTLRRRVIDESLQFWGKAPPPEDGRFTRLRRRLRVHSRMLPIAAAVAASVAILLLLRPTTPAYGWESMLRSLRSGLHNVVLETSGAGPRPIGSTDRPAAARRWIAVSSGIVGQSSGRRQRYVDVPKGVLIDRDGPSVRRASLDAASPTAGQLLAGWLLGLTDPSEMTRLGVTDRGWRTLPKGLIELTVEIDREGTRTVFQIVVDRQTQRPRSFRTGGGAVQVIRSVPRAGDWLTDGMAATVRDVPLAAIEPWAAAAASTPEAVGVDMNVDRPEAYADLAAEVDRILDQLWIQKGVQPAGPADEATWMRRVYLDLVGRIPSVAEAREYLADSSPDRDDRLVDRLLAGGDHATHLATVWRRSLLPDGVDLTPFGGTESFDRWLADRWAAGVGYDEMTRELLTARGRLSLGGPLLFYAATKLDPDQLAARTSRVFLGMRLECAQCHDDPFESHTQEDFWGYAAWFARISRPQTALTSVSTVMRVHDTDRGDVRLPESQLIVVPKFIGQDPDPDIDWDNHHLDRDAAVTAEDRVVSRRQHLARWVTSPENPYFARATANRVWSHLMGRGIVDPVDGFGDMNPPVSDELLRAVTRSLIAGGFDIRQLMRSLVATRAYRLSSGTGADDESTGECFAVMHVKTLTADQVYDSIVVAAMLDQNGGRGRQALRRTGNAARADFIDRFAGLSGDATRYQGGIPLALTMMNGPLVESATDSATSGLLQSLAAPFLSDHDRIEILYLATLSRPPSDAQQQLLQTYLSAADDRQVALADVLWSLLNSAEFVMNH